MTAALVGSESGLWVWLLVGALLVGFAVGAVTVVWLLAAAGQLRHQPGADLRRLRDAERARQQLSRVVRP